MGMLRYCTHCDRDVFTGFGPCSDCGTDDHVIQRHTTDKCAACGETWVNHGKGPGKSASACYLVPGGHFVPQAGTPVKVHQGQPPPAPIASPATSGMKCAKCGDFNQYGSPNVGSQFICYTCRQ